MRGAFDTFQLAALGAFLVLFLGRTAQMYLARGVRVFQLVRGKPWSEALLEALFLVTFPLWLADVIGHAWPNPFDVIPASLDPALIDVTGTRWIGVVLQVAGLGLFAASLASFGSSWRVGVDQRAPGSLVTTGVFAWSRNPIFLSMDLCLVGSFLLNGQLVTLLFAAGAILGFHRQILHEERFLGRHYGRPYESYRTIVRRYLGRTAGAIR